MSKLMRSRWALSSVALLLAACGAIGGGQSSEGGTHTLTGGAEAAPTSEATPQPARPRGDIERGTTRESSGGASGSVPGSGTGGDATTGGAEAAPTIEGTPPASSSGGSSQDSGGAGGLYDEPGGLEVPRP